MGTMKFEVSHSLPKDEAKKRVEQLLHYWGSKYGVKADWAGDGAKLNGKVMGINLDASFVITDKAVVGRGHRPWNAAARPGQVLPAEEVRRGARSEQEPGRPQEHDGQPVSALSSSAASA